MPTIVQTVSGVVTGLWGSALRRTPSGKLVALKLGDIVQKGDLILTTQDGIVKLEPVPEGTLLAAPASLATDIDRVISDLERDAPDAAPAAGLLGGGEGGLQPGLRVDRIAQALSPLQFVQESVDLTRPVFEGGETAPENQLARELRASSSSIAAAEEGSPVNLGLSPPYNNTQSVMTVTVTQIPLIGTIMTADGTVVTAGTALLPSQLPGLVYVPPQDYDGVSPVGTFGYTVSDGTTVATGSTTIGLSPVNDLPIANAGTATGLEDSALPISLTGQDIDGAIVSVTIVSVPPGSTIYLADGVTPVVAGQTLTPEQAATLLFTPAPDFNGGTVVTFTVTDNDGGVSAPATIDIQVISVNDPPVASPTTTTGHEGTGIPVSLGGTDVDGNVVSVTITTPPANGTLYLADGITPVAPGTPLTPAEAAGLVFQPNPGFIGPVTIGFTVTDDEGGESAPATAAIQVTPVPALVTLAVSDAAVTEGGSVVYSATVDRPVTGSPLVLTLSNGSVISIPVGQTTGSSAPYAVRPDDAYVQGNETLDVGISASTGGGFSTLDTSSTASTVVSDDADTTTITLTASAATAAEGGSIVYTVSVNNPVTGSPLVVSLTNGQAITIPVGQSSAHGAPFNVRPDDVHAQPDDTLVVGISGTSGGAYEALDTSATASTIVSDNGDSTTVSLSASATVAEGGTIIYTATLTAPADTAVEIRLSNGAIITIAAGASSGSAAVAAPLDDVYLDAGAVSATIASATGGNFENLVVDGTPAATDVTDTLDTTTVALTATPSVAEGGSITYTAALTSPAGTDVTITLSNGEQITISAGASSGSVVVAAPTDDAYVDAGDVSATITGTSGGNFEHLVVDGTPAVTAVTDTIDTTTVSITGSASVTEGGTATYTISLTNPSQTPVTITLGYSGTATDGADYAGVTTVVIPAHATSATFSVATLDDVLPEGTESFTVTIASATGGNFENLVLDPLGSAVTTALLDNDVATVSLSATPSITEAGGNIVYTVTVTDPPLTPLTVTLDNGTIISIPAGATSGSASVSIAPSDDVYIDPSVLSAAIASTSGGGMAVAIDPTPALTDVLDTIDTTTVSLSASAGAVAEGGSIVYTVSVNHPVTGSALVVSLSNGQTVTIPVGQSSAAGAPFNVRPDDAHVQPDDTLTVSITGTAGGAYEALDTSATATTVVSDDADATTVSLSATSTVAEGGSITYTASLTAPAQTPVTITLSNNEQIVIAAGASSGSVVVAAPDDDAYVDAGDVSAHITSATGGNFESLVVDATPALTAVTDTIDTTTIGIAGTASVTEGGTATYTLTLTQPAQSAVTVTLNYSGTATDGTDFTGVTTVVIPIGATSGTFDVATLDDLVPEGAESFTVSIASTAGGNFESLVVDPLASSVSTSILDNDSATVSLSATPSITEAGGIIVFTATVTTAPLSALTVHLDNNAVIIIPAGATSATTMVPIPPSDDVYIDPWVLSAEITSVSGGGFAVDFDPTPALTNVVDTIDDTTVSLTATAAVVEGGAITYTATLTSPAHAPVTVTLDNGVVIDIPIGASAASATWTTADDDVYLTSDAISATISSATGGNFENLVVDATPAVTTVSDTIDTTYISLTGSASVVEGETAHYSVVVSNPTQSAVTVTLNYSGTAVDGVDFTGVATVVIPAGAAAGHFSIDTINDLLPEATETFNITIASVSGGNFESLVLHPENYTHSTTIVDNDAPPVIDLDDDDSAALGTGFVTTFTEGGAAVSIADTDIAITDVDSTELVSATITLTNAQAGDVISAGAMPPGIMASVAGNVITLTGPAALATYQTAIRAITFTNTAENPTTVDRLIDVVVNDGANDSNVARAVVHVVALNELPEGRDLIVTTDEDTAYVFALSDFPMDDAEDGSNVSANGIRIDTLPTNGSLLLNGIPVSAGQVITATQIAAGELSFVPVADANGAAYASLTFSVRDSAGEFDAVPNTVTVNVTPVNDVATISGDATGAVIEAGGVGNSSVGTPTASGTLIVHDVDTGEASFQTPPAGSLTGTYGTFTFDPASGNWTYVLDNTLTATQALNAGEIAQDTLTVTSTDGTASQIVSITVTGTNDVAVIGGTDSGWVHEDEDIMGFLVTNGTLTVSDVDAGQASFQPDTIAGAYGTLTLDADGNWTYSADNSSAAVQGLGERVVAQDTFTVRSVDGTTHTVTINLQGKNEIPTALATPSSGQEDTAIQVTLNGSDIDGYVARFIILALPENGTLYHEGIALSVGDRVLAVNDTTPLTFVPDANWHGSTSVTFSANDDQGGISAAVTQTITVTPVNDAPIAANDSFTTAEDTPIAISAANLLANDSDIDGDTLSITAVGDATHGTVALVGGNVVFTPAPDYFGPASFTYTVSDGQGGTSTATVNVNVTAVNDAPTASNGQAHGTEDTPLVLAWSQFNAHDVDSPASALSVRIQSLPVNGVLQYRSSAGANWTDVSTPQVISKASIDAGLLRFLPGLNESGTDAFGAAGTGNLRNDYATFNYQVTDGSLNSPTTTMTIDIAPVADAPLLALSGSTISARSDFESVNLGSSQWTSTTLATSLPSTGGATWRTDNPGGQLEVGYQGVYTGDGNMTNKVVELERNAGDASNLYTQISTRAGEVYELSFDYSARMQGGSLIQVYWEGRLVQTLDSSVPGFQHFTLNLLATTTGSTRLEFVAPGRDSYGGILDDIELSRVEQNLGFEGQSIKLSNITASLNDRDGSETLSLSMAGIPVGGILSDGVRSFTATAGATTADISGWTLDNLYLRPPLGYTGTAELTVTATATEVNGDSSQASRTFSVLVAPLPVDNTASTPGLSVLSSVVAVAPSSAVAAIVAFPVLATLTDADGSESLAIRITGVPSGATFSAGTRVSSTVWSFVPEDLHDLTLALPAAYSTSSSGVTMTVSATSTEASNGETAVATQTVTLFADYAGNALTGTSAGNTLTGGNGNDHIQGLAGNDTINAGNGNDLVYGGTGNDTINGGNGNDVLYGDAGNDTINGGAGNDRIIGGAGNDRMTGGAGTDVFAWDLADAGPRGTPAVDTITDFNTTSASSGGDVLDLRDLLNGSALGPNNTAGNLINFLDFNTTGADTVIRVSSNGGFTNGDYNAAAEDQRIVLEGVNLRTELSLSSTSTDAQIIQELLSRNKLITDGS